MGVSGWSCIHDVLRAHIKHHCPGGRTVGRVAAGMNVQHVCTALRSRYLVFPLPFFCDKRMRISFLISHLRLIPSSASCLLGVTSYSISSWMTVSMFLFLFIFHPKLCIPTYSILIHNTMLTTCNIHPQRPGRQLDLRRRQHAHPDPRDDDGPAHRRQGAERRVHRECHFSTCLLCALFCLVLFLVALFLLAPFTICGSDLFRGFASSFCSLRPVSPSAVPQPPKLSHRSHRACRQSSASVSGS